MLFKLYSLKAKNSTIKYEIYKTNSKKLISICTVILKDEVYPYYTWAYSDIHDVTANYFILISLRCQRGISIRFTCIVFEIIQTKMIKKL